MLKLMKLELEKRKLKGFVFAFLGIILFLIAFAMLGRLNKTELLYKNQEELLLMSDIIFRVCFTIFGGVLIAELIIDEFNHNTIQLLFTYPISRKKIFGSKLLLTFLIVFVAIVAANIIFLISICTINQWIVLLPNELPFSIIYEQLLSIFISALLTSGISLICLYVGFRKKTITSTIISSVIISMVLNGNVGVMKSASEQVTLYSIIIIPILLCIIGIGIAIWSFKNINDMDI